MCSSHLILVLETDCNCDCDYNSNLLSLPQSQSQLQSVSSTSFRCELHTPDSVLQYSNLINVAATAAEVPMFVDTFPIIPVSVSVSFLFQIEIATNMANIYVI